MPSDALAIGAGNDADTPSKEADSGKKARLLTLDSIDRRTAAYKNIVAMRDALIEERGGRDRLSMLECEACEQTAIITAMFKDQASQWTQGDPVDASSIMVLINAWRRHAELLGTKRVERNVTPTPAEYMAMRAREKASPIVEAAE